MVAKHTIEEEIEPCSFHGVQPTPQAFGICGTCRGQGEIPEFNDKTGKYMGMDFCSCCGGDGKSERVSP